MAEFTFAPLTPVAFLDRAAAAFADRIAVNDEELSFTYADLADRVRGGVDALTASGIGPGERVAALCANSHVMLELHNLVPAAGAVLVPINIRLSVEEVVYIVEHSGARLLFATRDLASVAGEVASRTGVRLILEEGPDTSRAGRGEETYESWLSSANRPGPGDSLSRNVDSRLPLSAGVVDERQMLAINYTSGTTGRPKGVIYHHRGAYLQAAAMAFHLRLRPGSRYLWTLPMFHCDGWCLTWAVTAAGGTHMCLRTVDAGQIWHQVSAAEVTHLSAAPTVLTMLAEHPSAAALSAPVHVSTGGAPPTPALLSRLEPLGLDITHLYGLTETFGPIVVNDWQPEWDDLPAADCARLKARQGVGNVAASPLRVLTPAGEDVPADGVTLGELAVLGNNVMSGYYRDEEATAAVTRSGCFLTGDLAVTHPDGYVEIRDRGKDIIISGGENIASVEIERAIDTHPSVVESAVVAGPDDRWGEVPVAFVTVRDGAKLTAAEVADHVRTQLARFKAPKQVVFTSLPKTSTGKVQKGILRSRAAQPSGGANHGDDGREAAR